MLESDVVAVGRALLLSFAVAGIGCSDEVGMTDEGTTGDVASSSVGSVSSSGGMDSPAACPGSSHVGPADLPDGFLGEPYDVHLSAYGAPGGGGYEVSDGIPPGLETRDAHLFGLPAEVGMFEFVISAGQHYLTPGCDPPGPSTAIFRLVIRDGSSTSSSSGSTSESSDSSSGSGDSETTTGASTTG